MEIVLAICCVFYLFCFYGVIGVIILNFRDSKKKNSISQNKEVALLAITYQTPDAKTENPLRADAELANPGHTINTLDTRSYSDVNKSTVMLNQYNCPALPTIPEDQEWVELEKCKSESHQRQKTACCCHNQTDTKEEKLPDVPTFDIGSRRLIDICSVISSLQDRMPVMDFTSEHWQWTINLVLEQSKAENLFTAFRIRELTKELATSELQLKNMTEMKVELDMELNSLRKSLSEQAAKIEQLQNLVVEKGVLAEQLANGTVNTALELRNKSSEITELRKEIAEAQKSVKETTKDFGCQSDAVGVAVASSRPTTKDVVRCGTEEVTSRPVQTFTTEQQMSNEDSCRFGLDLETMGQFSKQPFLPFGIPDRVQIEAPVSTSPKPDIRLPVSDTRNRNKPMSGDVVNSDGAILTYSDALKSKKNPENTVPNNKTETVGLPVLEHPKETSTINGPEKTDDLFIITKPIKRQSLRDKKLVLKNIPGEDYGRIIGSGGSNIRRVENEFKIRASITISVDGNCLLVITGNTEEVRHAAANDIVQGLTVTTECSDWKQFNQISNTRMKEIARTFFVKIIRPPPSDNFRKMTVTGKLCSCKLACAALVAEIKRLH